MTPRTARAALFHAPDRPLELATLPLPDPASGELLVRVECCTVCRSDLHTHAGRRHGPTPAILGHEIVGRVESFGAGTARVDARGEALHAGDRVTWSVMASCGVCFYCARDLPQKCERLVKYGHEGIDRRPFGGGLAEYILLAPGTAVVRLPDEIPDAVAASANCATATVAGLLRHAGEVRGASVLILGAGVLGLTACAMASAVGAELVAVGDPDPDRASRGREFGATHALSPVSDESAAALTAGRGFDVVLELAGVKAAVESGLSAVRIGGTLILAGTVLPTPPVALDPERVVRRMLTIRGVHNYAPRDLIRAVDFLAGPGRSFPFASLVGATFRLEEVERAIEHAHAHPGIRVAVVP